MIVSKVQTRTFQDLANTMAELRRTGGEGIVKRENFTDFPALNQNIEFVRKNYLNFASFGYVERLIRKLAAEFADKKYKKLTMVSYKEACGLFSGRMTIEFENSDEANGAGTIEDINFVWQGKGEIEQTWNQFFTWEKSLS